MRQIYTSPRHENVDRVVQLLNEHGIETTLTNRRAYHGSDWKRFSYSQRSDESAWPQVWIVNADDQTRAREVLREIGIEPATRYADEFPSESRKKPELPPVGPERHRAVASRMRLAILGLVVVAAILLAIKTFSMQ
ncbi:MAG: hypothetical protein ABI411_20240 [Tahibacter sp.]